MDCIAYIDGGRVPGTKLTTIGGFILKDGAEIARYYEIGGVGSNADAEWQSLIRCMGVAVEHNVSSVHIKTDFRPVADMLRTEYEILQSMVSELECNPDNRGLRKTLIIRTKQRFGSVKTLREWIEKNKTCLKATDSFPGKYKKEIIGAMESLEVTLELIPREANYAADELCRIARKEEI